MLTVDTLAEIDEDGTLTAKTPAYGTKGRRRVVIVIDEAEGNRSTVPRRLPDLSDFRARLNCKPYPGNSVVDLRDEER